MGMTEEKRYGETRPGCPTCGSGAKEGHTLEEIMDLFDEDEPFGQVARELIAAKARLEELDDRPDE